nr:DUF1402 family protein [Rhizobium sp. RCAM05973]
MVPFPYTSKQKVTTHDFSGSYAIRFRPHRFGRIDFPADSHVKPATVPIKDRSVFCTEHYLLGQQLWHQRQTLPAENYYGWPVNDRLPELRGLLGQ